MRLWCDAYAVADGWMNSKLYLLSCCGPAATIKSAMAALRSGGKDVGFAFSGAPNIYKYKEFGALGTGYTIRKARISCDNWHMVAIARSAGLVACVSDQSLWEILHSDRFTTPIMRHWIPYIRAEMEDKRFLVPLKCFGCEAALIKADSDDLDRIVSLGLSSGRISFPSTE